jgi:heme exporter protein A
VLDEPFSALDTAAIELLGTLISEHLAAGGVAVLTSHQPVALLAGQEIML